MAAAVRVFGLVALVMSVACASPSTANSPTASTTIQAKDPVVPEDLRAPLVLVAPNTKVYREDRKTVAFTTAKAPSLWQLEELQEGFALLRTAPDAGCYRAPMHLEHIDLVVAVRLDALAQVTTEATTFSQDGYTITVHPGAWVDGGSLNVGVNTWPLPKGVAISRSFHPNTPKPPEGARRNQQLLGNVWDGAPVHIGEDGRLPGPGQSMLPAKNVDWFRKQGDGREAGDGCVVVAWTPKTPPERNAIRARVALLLTTQIAGERQVWWPDGQPAGTTRGAFELHGASKNVSGDRICGDFGGSPSRYGRLVIEELNESGDGKSPTKATSFRLCFEPVAEP